METSMWQQVDNTEEEMLHNEIIDEPFYDEIFGMPFDYEYEGPEVGREFDLKSYEAVPGDDHLIGSKANHKQKNQVHSGNHRQPNLLDPHEQTIEQKQANLVEEEEVNLEEQANLHWLTNLKKQTDQQQFNQPQATDVETIMMSPPEPFISWGRQHLPNRELSNKPSPPDSPFSFQSSLVKSLDDPPTLRNIFGSSPTKGGNPQSERDNVWETTGFPRREPDFLRRKRNEGRDWESKDGFNPPQISYYFTLDDAIDRNSIDIINYTIFIINTTIIIIKIVILLIMYISGMPRWEGELTTSQTR